MGEQIYHSKYTSDKGLEPGTYRVFNVHTKTAIQVSDHDPTKIVTWARHNGENQQWFLQRSGLGYQLRNRQHDVYMAVASTDKHGLVYASRYPTTWLFLKAKGNHIIQLADKNRVLDLHYCSADNGTEIHIWQIGEEPHKIWGLERLGDNSGEEIPVAILAVRKGEFDAQMELVNKELVKRQEKIANKDREVSQLQDELSSAKEKLSELHSLLYQRDETIQQLQKDLKSKEEALSHAYKVNEESVRLRNQHSLLESKFLQQQTETTSLQSKMDRVEYLMSQMMSKPNGNTGTNGAD
ncbi:ricin-type beta-trefoil lectin domain protein [Rhizoctonia solani AG-3 Rhs1AP]|uniref:Ricin-type beta-trefoil lectin domain protein n=1 Tax=Rhizoctonia solani AG-3 Rhs1AP TaxID=1086054 RepID=X8JS77_9AGAM|nr:ricin-type beta-trefoil lectin domain protein [Rhizoctonia solani AG-3 Rhs1AP]